MIITRQLTPNISDFSITLNNDVDSESSANEILFYVPRLIQWWQYKTC